MIKIIWIVFLTCLNFWCKHVKTQQFHDIFSLVLYCLLPSATRFFKKLIMILFFWICKCAWFLSKPLETSQNNLGIMLLCTINDDRSFFNSTPFTFLSLCMHLHSKNKWQLKTTNKKRQTQCWTTFISSQEEDFDTYNKSLCFLHPSWMMNDLLLVAG